MTSTALNAICPYFTMFPLEFPVRLLRRALPDDAVLDPFCGRGTTNLAARIRGLHSVGIDTSPVAAAIARAKLLAVRPDAVVAHARRILADDTIDDTPPDGEFWSLAFAPNTLRAVCRLRVALSAKRSGPKSHALAALALGALHGPRSRGLPSYFSNQMPRTFASKPGYSVRYWRAEGLVPTEVDVLDLIRRRAQRYFGDELPRPNGRIIEGDARKSSSLAGERTFDWVITSPPYYGLRTYVPDQWLRLWFLGGSPDVQYRGWTQIGHASPEQFAADLAVVWKHVAQSCRAGARMIVRFGGISTRSADPEAIFRESIGRMDGWRLTTSRSAGDAAAGRRQAPQFNRGLRLPVGERDYFSVRE